MYYLALPLARSVHDNNPTTKGHNYISFSSSSSNESVITHSLSNPQAVLPPHITLNYSDEEYEGLLLTYKYRNANSFGQLGGSKTVT
jgi:hypothetical protein